MDKRESKRVIINECYLENIESKSVQMIITTNEVKYAMNKTKDETKDEEPLVTYDSVINTPIYFKLFGCGKTFLKNVYSTCERVCKANLQRKWDMEVLMYRRVCILDKKEKYYTEISTTITNFNDKNKSLLSNVKSREVILKVVI